MPEQMDYEIDFCIGRPGIPLLLQPALDRKRQTEFYGRVYERRIERYGPGKSEGLLQLYVAENPEKISQCSGRKIFKKRYRCLFHGQGVQEISVRPAGIIMARSAGLVFGATYQSLLRHCFRFYAAAPLNLPRF
jgi:hypothetical protein